MTVSPRSTALVGAVGGAGTTRLTVELAGTLARDGHDVAVLDVDLATQGLAGYVPGRVDPDLTTALTGEHRVAETLVDRSLDVPGRVAVAAARAPFDRLARAKTADAAQRLEASLTGDPEDPFDDSAPLSGFDHVLLDVPPVVDNLSVAAVRSADRVAVVTPGTRRGADGVPKVRERLTDVGTAADALVVTRAEDAAGLDPDVVVPPADAAPEEVPTSATEPDPTFAPRVAGAAEAACGVDLDLAFPDEGVLGRF